ncbi:hypothetical protein VNO78_00670 [Psophocarpus tetragonolobus]|uniref:Uncharacterized protein n=1 Tax=Psophocarpus tetragonolobus TaxID=3891 RepID=A0AAN9XTX8_PSOTE
MCYVPSGVAAAALSASFRRAYFLLFNDFMAAFGCMDTCFPMKWALAMSPSSTLDESRVIVDLLKPRAIKARLKHIP